MISRLGHPVLIVLMIMSMSCGNGGPIIEVVNGGTAGSWSDGTVLIAFRDDEVAGSAVLYGDHTRITLHSEGVYRLRAGNQTHLTAVIGPFTVRKGINRVELPVATERRRIAGQTIGLSVASSSLPGFFLDDGTLQVTTLTIPVELVGEVADKVHRQLTEVIAQIIVSPSQAAGIDDALVAATLDSIAAAGADGVLLDSGDTTPPAEWPDTVRMFAIGAHERGKTIALMVRKLHADPEGWYPLTASTHEQPDEVRIQVPITAPLDLLDTVAGLVQTCIAAGIPAEKLSMIFDLTARGGDTSTHELIVPALGEIDSLVALSGGVMRLQDGTCRFGYGGVVYDFDDAVAVAKKVRILRGTIGGPVGGVHLFWDGTGMTPDAEGLVAIREAAAEIE